MIERPKKVLRAAFAVMSLLVMGYVIYLGWGQVRDAASLHRHWHYIWIVAAVFMQLLVYLCIAGMFRLSLNSYSKELSPAFLFYSAFAFLFANRSLPGPAVAGVATLVYLMRGKSVPPVDAQAAAASFYFADYAGFFTLIAVVSVPLLAEESHPAVRAIYLAGLSVIVVAAIFTVIVFAKPRLLVSVISKIVSNFQGDTIGNEKNVPLNITVEKAIIGLHEKIMYNAKSPLLLCEFFVLSVVMHCSESATVVLGAKASGITVGIPVAAASYVAGNLASIVSVLPGAVGFYETGMVGTLHGAGHLSIGDSVVCALIYRVLSFWAPMPVVISVLLKVSREGLFDVVKNAPKTRESNLP